MLELRRSELQNEKRNAGRPLDRDPTCNQSDRSKKCDGDLSLLLELKDDLSHFCDTTVPQKCDSVTWLSQSYVAACSTGKLSFSLESKLCDSL